MNLDMADRNSVPEEFACIWPRKGVGIITIETEKRWVHSSCDVFVVVSCRGILNSLIFTKAWSMQPCPPVVSSSVFSFRVDSILKCIVYIKLKDSWLRAFLSCMNQTSRDRVNSCRVRTHENNSGDAVRRLSLIIQSIFCAQSGDSIRLTVWKWSGESRYPGAFPPVLENFRGAFSPGPTDSPWVSEDVVTSKLDNCNALLYGLSEYKIQRLQYVLTSASKLVTLSRKHDHISPVPMELHWLPIEQRVEVKILLFTCKVVNGMAPAYLQDLLDLHRPCRSLRSGNKQLLKTQCYDIKSYAYRAFSTCAPSLGMPFQGS